MGADRRRALVTGGANGIGAAIAELLVDRGVEVIVADRDTSVMATAARIGATGLLLDVAHAESVADLQGIVALDVLVNSAAIAPSATLDVAHLLDTMRSTVEVNVVGVAAVVAAVLPQLRLSDSARILNIGSIQGFAAQADAVAYATSKGALHSLTRSLAVDLARHGILVNALAPGFVDTAMARLADGTSEYETDWFRSVYIEHGRIPLRRPAEAREIAEAAEYFVSERNTYVTGATVPVDGGLLATF